MGSKVWQSQSHVEKHLVELPIPCYHCPPSTSLSSINTITSSSSSSITWKEDNDDMEWGVWQEVSWHGFGFIELLNPSNLWTHQLVEQLCCCCVSSFCEPHGYKNLHLSPFFINSVLIKSSMGRSPFSKLEGPLYIRLPPPYLPTYPWFSIECVSWCLDHIRNKFAHRKFMRTFPRVQSVGDHL